MSSSPASVGGVGKRRGLEPPSILRGQRLAGRRARTNDARTDLACRARLLSKHRSAVLAACGSVRPNPHAPWRLVQCRGSGALDVKDIEAAIRIWNAGKSRQELVSKFVQTNATKESVAIGDWAWQWAEDGFWTITTGARYAAALMATNTAGAKGDLILPGRAVKIVIPDSVLPGHKNVYVSDSLFIATAVDVCGAMFWENEGDDDDWCSPGHTISICGAERGIDELLFDPLDDFAEGRLGWESVKEVTLIRRLVVGLLYTMQHTTNFRSRAYATKGSATSNHRAGPPDHRAVFVGSSIAMDARPQIAEWLRTSDRTASPPSVQHVVRGHYKRQVIGAAGSFRKIVWIEPYWRGPEDAPILVHPRLIGGAR